VQFQQRKQKKHGGTTNLKIGDTNNLRTKQAEKNWSTAELSHFVLCVFRYFRQFAIQKICLPNFQFFTSPNFIQRHLPPTVNGVDASGQLDGRLQRVGSAIPKVHYSESLLFPLTLRLTLTLTLTQMLALWCVSAQWTFGIADLRNSGPVLTPTTTTSPTQKS